MIALNEGREVEGVDLLRNALVALPLCEHSEAEADVLLELNVLTSLIDALFKTDAIEEVLHPDP